MYDEWVAVGVAAHDRASICCSVLNKLPGCSAPEVVQSVARALASTLGIATAPQPSTLTDDAEVVWCMEALCYGLALPLAEHDTIRDCVNVYCEWMTALTPLPKLCVPAAIVEQPNLYGPRMLQHLQNLFVPRSGQTPDTVNRQAVLCHRVLRTVQSLSRQPGASLDDRCWTALLLFQVTVNDALLAPPTVKDDIGDQMCERVLSVLFDVWIQACHRCFPSPSLWKTFRDNCQHWRHRGGLVDQWSRVMLALTYRLVADMYAVGCGRQGAADLIPADMTPTTVAQTWYRMLHTLGNPVQISDASVISGSQQFLQYAITNEAVVEPYQHPCLSQLPDIFHKCMKALAQLVNIFLGQLEEADCRSDISCSRPGTASSSGGGSPVVLRGRTSSTNSNREDRGSISSMSGSLAGSSTTAAMTSTLSEGEDLSATAKDEMSAEDIQYLAGRPKCNSILALFGAWLFEAATVGTSLGKSFRRARRGHVKRASTVYLESTISSVSSTTPEPADLPASLLPGRFEVGRAQALGTLSRIFCAKKAGEDVAPTYLATFYRVVFDALVSCTSAETNGVSITLTSLLLNGWRLLQVDLDGVNCLLPALTDALTLVLAQRAAVGAELRRSAVRLLVSALPLPLHFQHLIVREPGAPAAGHPDRPLVSFLQLRPRLLALLMNALQSDSDPANCQTLLGALLASLLDCTVYERSLSDCSANTAQQLQPAPGAAADSISLASDLSVGSSSTAAVDSGSAPPLDSARGLYVRAIHLVAHRLMSSWKSDFNTSLAALEVLTGLAGVHFDPPELAECKSAVKYLCDFFSHQCSRPPPYHSKDLHSTMVAALRCVAVWLLEHPDLLDEASTLAIVLHVVELGISGSVSATVKEEKPLRPVSMRVREAAEGLLFLLMEQVGCAPAGGAVSACSSQLTEGDLLALCQPGAQFRYLMTDALLLALLEQPLGNDQQPQPSVTLLVRGPSLRTGWMMQLRHQPRHLSGVRVGNPGRPLPDQPAPQQSRRALSAPHFPPLSGVGEHGRLPACRADRSVPALQALVLDQRAASQHNFMLELIQRRQNESDSTMTTGDGPNLDTECCPPAPRQEFQTARLLLRHLQLLGPGGAGGPRPSEAAWRAPRQLVPLDAERPEFARDLEALDATSFRLCYEAHVYYVRSGRVDVDSVLANASAPLSALDPNYGRFLQALGSRTSAAAGGNAEWGAEDGPTAGGSASCILYWADALTELTIRTPTRRPAPLPPAAQESTAHKRRCEPAVLVVWLERYEDERLFPVSDLVPAAMCDATAAIFVHPLNNKLFRIHLRGPAGKMAFATPLVDGLVVSRRSLGHLVRQTAINVCHRRRLEADTCHPPHVQRRLKIQEIKQKYEISCSQPEFFTQLFTHNFFHD